MKFACRGTLAAAPELEPKGEEVKRTLSQQGCAGTDWWCGQSKCGKWYQESGAPVKPLGSVALGQSNILAGTAAGWEWTDTGGGEGWVCSKGWSVSLLGWKTNFDMQQYLRGLFFGDGDVRARLSAVVAP